MLPSGIAMRCECLHPVELRQSPRARRFGEVARMPQTPSYRVVRERQGGAWPQTQRSCLPQSLGGANAVASAFTAPSPRLESAS